MISGREEFRNAEFLDIIDIVLRKLRQKKKFSFLTDLVRAAAAGMTEIAKCLRDGYQPDFEQSFAHEYFHVTSKG